jgi:DNA-3-methyladenine glycosylase
VSAPGDRLGRRFFARPSTVVARELLGRVLVRNGPRGVRIAARIVETEAYEETDPASHSYRGRTTRTDVMFGPAGHLYVYFTYGMHFCMNVVTAREGQGSAVLLRGAEPLEGLGSMKRRRGTTDARLLCAGPARLCRAFGIDRRSNGADLVEGGAIWIDRGRRVPDERVLVGARVGISSAIERPWRFSVLADPFVSRGRPIPAARLRG